MGDRVAVKFCNTDEVSPVIYLHWQGAEVLKKLAVFFRSKPYTDRPRDVDYNFARFVAHACQATSDSGMSIGVLNDDTAPDAWLADRKKSPGDAGLVLVDYRRNAIRLAHGYLSDTTGVFTDTPAGNKLRDGIADAKDELQKLGFAVIAEGVLVTRS